MTIGAPHFDVQIDSGTDPLRVVAQGDMRPFSTTKGATSEAMEDLRRILASRESLYARADAVVDTAARTLKQSLSDLKRAVPQPSPNKETT